MVRCMMSYRMILCYTTVLTNIRKLSDRTVINFFEEFLTNLDSATKTEEIVYQEEMRFYNQQYLLYEKQFGIFDIKSMANCGIFAISKQHIQNRSLESYKQLITYLDHHSNPEAGHYFERSWLAIFHSVPENNLYPLI